MFKNYNASNSVTYIKLLVYFGFLNSKIIFRTISELKYQDPVNLKALHNLLV